MLTDIIVTNSFQDSMPVDTVSILANFGLIGATVGIALGTAGHQLVQALVKDIIYPVLGAFVFRKEHLDNFTIRIGGSKVAIGNFLLVLLEFLIVLFLVFVILRYMLGGTLAEVIKQKGKHGEIVEVQNQQMIKHLQYVVPGGHHSALNPPKLSYRQNMT
jgi:large-conductance mechanosensitive channel